VTDFSLVLLLLFYFCNLRINLIIVLCCVAYLPGVKSSGGVEVHGALLNALEKAYRDQSLCIALLQLTQPGCSCIEAHSCLVPVDPFVFYFRFWKTILQSFVAN